MTVKQNIVINLKTQTLHCFVDEKLTKIYPISSGKNGVGEREGSGCTPRGHHQIHSIIGQNHELYSVFVGRVWTGEIYSEALARQFPERDWILTRILRLEGMEPGRNQGGDVDSFNRYIYIHGTPDSTRLGTPESHGCIRMHNADVIELADWASVGTAVHINETC